VTHAHMQAIAIRRSRCRVVCLSVCLSVGHDRESCKNAAEPIAMPFRKLTRVSPRNHVLDGGTYGRHLANNIERSKTAAMRHVSTLTIATCHY